MTLFSSVTSIERSNLDKHKCFWDVFSWSYMKFGKEVVKRIERPFDVILQGTSCLVGYLEV